MIEYVAIEKPQDLLGAVVISKRGRDKGKRGVILGWLPGDFALVADGKRRPAAKPKKKNMKHLIFAQRRSGDLDIKLLSGGQAADRMIKDILDAFANQTGNEP